MIMPQGEFQTHHRIKAVRDIARQMRQRPTRSEDLLWQRLRNRRLGGLKFLRQHPVGPSILDFYCHEKRVAIEVDGTVHQRQDIAQMDRARQELIEAYGIRFFRCSSAAVEQDIDSVLEGILKAAEE